MSSLLFALVVLVAMGLFVHTVYDRVRLLLASRPIDRFDQLAERLKAVLVYAFGQKKFVTGEQPAGWMHFFIFWGFVILGLQIVTMFARAFSEHFYVPGFAPHLLGGPFLVLRDLMEVIVSAAILLALYRWLVSHPPRLFGYRPAETRLAGQSHWEAVVILLFILTIMSGGLLYDGGRLVYLAGNPSLEAERPWEPASAVVGALLTPLGAAWAKGISDVAWWVHNLVVLAFLNLLPRSKHFHILTSIPNVFFRKLEPVGALSLMDLENTETFGTSHIDQFTWKQTLDMYSCTECGRCSSHCPATLSGKPLAPRQLLLNLRDYLYEHQQEMINKRLGKTDGEVGENIVGETLIHDDVLWACTTCRACEEACPVLIEYVDKIVDMRRHLVQEEARFPAELTRTFKAMETQSNPWGLSYEKRAEWAEGLDIPLVAEHPDAEYLYFVGCAGSFDERNKKTTIAFAKLLKKAGVSFAILGPEEPCNGETARRLGNEYLFQSMAQTAIGVFTQYTVKKIIVNCPHCFNTIKNEFPQFDGHYEVIHAAELLSRLVREGKLTLQAQPPQRVTYHDSCYYGRYNDIYDTPREILTKIPGTQLQEMERHKHTGMCCGGGGGWMWMEEPHDKRVNHLRVAQALETQPDTIAVSCPFCMIMLGDGLKAKSDEETVQLLDVVELVGNSTS
ncbi:MAG: (Fe-S)-binding protein [Deltaproteobacteria bacterium]|nr:(Fe-S)-binding protein [Deltaproteobacteria bacterium]